jgi:hypothetical protein
LFSLFVRHLFVVYLILLWDGILFSAEQTTSINILIYYHSLFGQILLSIRNIFYIFLIFDLFYFVLCGFSFLFVLFYVFCWGFFVSVFVFYCVFVCFCFVFAFYFLFTFIAFNITLAWRTQILKVTKHSQHYISITWQTFWKGRSIHNITLAWRTRILKGT